MWCVALVLPSPNPYLTLASAEWPENSVPKTLRVSSIFHTKVMSRLALICALQGPEQHRKEHKRRQQPTQQQQQGGSSGAARVASLQVALLKVRKGTQRIVVVFTSDGMQVVR